VPRKDEGLACGFGEHDCPRTDRCKVDGKCTRETTTNRCVSTSDEDCKKSAECTESGYCHAIDGACSLAPANEK